MHASCRSARPTWGKGARHRAPRRAARASRPSTQHPSTFAFARASRHSRARAAHVGASPRERSPPDVDTLHAFEAALSAWLNQSHVGSRSHPPAAAQTQSSHGVSSTLFSALGAHDSTNPDRPNTAHGRRCSRPPRRLRNEPWTSANLLRDGSQPRLLHLRAVRRDAPRAPVIQCRPASRRTSTDRGETEPAAGASGGITRCGRQSGHHSRRAPVGASLAAGASGGSGVKRAARSRPFRS
jgi:hypothetical protein